MSCMLDNVRDLVAQILPIFGCMALELIKRTRNLLTNRAVIIENILNLLRCGTGPASVSGSFSGTSVISPLIEVVMVCGTRVISMDSVVSVIWGGDDETMTVA